MSEEQRVTGSEGRVEIGAHRWLPLCRTHAETSSDETARSAYRDARFQSSSYETRFESAIAMRMRKACHLGDEEIVPIRYETQPAVEAQGSRAYGYGFAAMGAPCCLPLTFCCGRCVHPRAIPHRNSLG
jgi:hypothetical protein